MGGVVEVVVMGIGPWEPRREYGREREEGAGRGRVGMREEVREGVRE